MKRIAKLNASAIIIFSTSIFVGCSGVPQAVDVNPEFRKQMEGKVIGEATGDTALWGQTEESVAKKIFPGKTTKSDIREIFGSTTKVALTETGETWAYESSVVTIMTGSSYTRNTLLVLFDENGVVRRYSMNVDKR
jgi:hypothetical protein